MADERVVLITGCGGGIGLATAMALAAAGWQVVATVRTGEQQASVAAASTGPSDAKKLDVRQLDVTDEAAVARTVEAIVTDHGQLDAVVNNAGMGHEGTVETDSVANTRAVMDANFFGLVHVAKAAMPHLRASRGRLVAVSSVAGAVGQPFNEAYCAAKHAVDGFCESLAPVAQAQGVQVIVVQPGAVATEFAAKARARAVPDVGEAYAGLLDGYHRFMQGAAAGGQTPAEVAAVIRATLEDPDPGYRVQTSRLARAIIGKSLADLDGRAVQSLTSKWIATGPS